MPPYRRADLLSLCNLRNDGRKADEIRQMSIHLGPIESTSVSGSALVQMGLTTVLVYVNGPTDCAKRSDECSEKAILEVQVRVEPFAPSNGDRRLVNPSTDRRVIEQSTLIQKALEASTLLHLHPRTRIIIEVRIFSDDGGPLCAAINACTLALVDAGIAIKDLLCACSVGTISGVSSVTSISEDKEREKVPILLDLNKSEISGHVFSGEFSHLYCAVMPQRRTIVLTQCDSRLPNATIFESMVAAGMKGCDIIFDSMMMSIKERMGKLSAAAKGNMRIQLSC